MRFLKVLLVFIFTIVLAFVAYTLLSTGFFRTVDDQFRGEILERIPLSGAEDIMISVEDSFALISATKRLSFPPKEQEKGGLYMIDLKSNSFASIPLTDSFDQAFAPHGISFFKRDSSYCVMAINHTMDGHFIEVFELERQRMKHIQTLKHSSMISPNDLVMIDQNRFYFTNDHKYVKGAGKLLEEYLGLAISNVVYFDGNNYREVANGIAFANGINFDAERNLLFVASPRSFLVKVYERNEDGSLAFVEDIPCGTGVDNVEFDFEGNLWIGAHPSLLRFNAYSDGMKETAPSEIIKITYRDKGDFTVESVFTNDGKEMSGASVAAVFKDLIFAGNVMDDKFLILKRDRQDDSK